MKTNKAFAKRIRLTKTGKLLSRPTGQNHFRAKKSRTQKLARKNLAVWSLRTKKVGHYLPHGTKK